MRENLADDQRADAELGRIILRLETDERPTKWDSLKVHSRLVYRRLDSSKPSTPTMLQLLVPRCCVPEVLRPCHIGTVGGRFGGKKTKNQVQRRFYLATWKTDERKYGKICSECSTYRRGKPSRQCRLNQVYDANDILFGNADDAYAPTIDYDDSVNRLAVE